MSRAEKAWRPGDGGEKAPSYIGGRGEAEDGHGDGSSLSGNVKGIWLGVWDRVRLLDHHRSAFCGPANRIQRTKEERA